MQPNHLRVSSVSAAHACVPRKLRSTLQRIAGPYKPFCPAALVLHLQRMQKNPDAWQYSERSTALVSGSLHNALWKYRICMQRGFGVLHLQRMRRSRKPGSTVTGRRPWAACRPAPRPARRAAAQTRSQTPRGTPRRAARAPRAGRRAARCAGTAPSTGLQAARGPVTASASAAAEHSCMLRHQRKTWVRAWHGQLPGKSRGIAVRSMRSSPSTGQQAA